MSRRLTAGAVGGTGPNTLIFGTNNITSAVPNANLVLTATGTGRITTAQNVTFTANTGSSSTSTGTLVVTGGVGISQNINIGGSASITGAAGVTGTLTATSIVETSSIAFKENVNPINNALDLVMQLAGVTYDRKDNNEHEAGLIAEQVHKIIPDLVSLDENGNPHGIKYTKLSAYLIEAIKHLKQEINDLKGLK